MEQNLTFWQRLTRKFRLSITDDHSLRQIWSVRWNWLSVVMFLLVMFLLIWTALSAIIIYTPARKLLPGYREDLSQQIIEQSARVDSLTENLQLQQQYVNMLKQVVAGDVQSDSIQPLDSIQIVMREQLLEAKSAATEEFIAQYEAKDNDRFQLFDIQSTSPVFTLFRPAEGVVLEHFNAEQNHPYIVLRTAEQSPITAVLAGSVVFTDYDMDNTYTIMVQHDTYLSIYRHATRLMKQVGDKVQAGEIVGMASSENDLSFYLWHGGKSVNPEELIVF